MDSLELEHWRSLTSAGIAHRDVKPANILLLGQDKENLEIKLGDFGFAIACGNDRLHAMVGTPVRHVPQPLPPASRALAVTAPAPAMLALDSHAPLSGIPCA